MKAFVHVNLITAMQNRRDHADAPALSVVTYRGVLHSRDVLIDEGHFRQDFAHPKKCGAVVTIEVADARKIEVLTDATD